MSTDGLENEWDIALHGLLTGSTAITDHLASGTAGVHHELAPQNADHPLVVFNHQAETTVWTFDKIAYENLLYEVKAISIGESFASAGTIDAAIASVLNDGTPSVTDYGLLYARRESGVRFPEVIEGQRINHRGGLYRIWLAPA